jgi:HAD superfamily hydrolase (TIGR01509 family)
MRALLWDVDGTIAETERDGHRVAFNLAFAEWNLPWRWDEARYGELLQVAGGRERLLHDMASRADAPERPEDRAVLARGIHARKNAIYAELVSGGRVPLRGGVRELMEECRAERLTMGIATTTSRANVDALLSGHLGPRWTEWFDAIVCGEDVERKKPDPAVFHVALQQLGIGSSEAVAIEDSPAGVAAARAAGVPVLVTRSSYFADAVIDGACAVGPGLERRRDWVPPSGSGEPEDGRVDLDDIRAWCQRTGPRSSAR